MRPNHRPVLFAFACAIALATAPASAQTPDATPLDTATRFVGSYRSPADSVVVARMLADAYALPRIHRDSALSMARAAVALVERSIVDSLHMDLAEAWHWVGRHSLSLARFADAEAAFRRELALVELLVGPDHPRRASALDYVARSLRAAGRQRESIPFYRQSLAARRRLADGVDDVDLAGSMNNLGLALSAIGAHAEAAALYEESLAMKRRLYPEGHVDLATTMNNLGLLELERGRVMESIVLLEEGVAMLRRFAEPQDPVLPAGIAALARAFDAAGRYDLAQTLAEEVVRLRAEIYAGDHPAVASARAHLGRLRWLAGDRAAGETMLREALAMHERMTMGGSQGTAATLFELGSLLRESRDRVGADSAISASLAQRRRLFAADHLAIAAVLIERGRILASEASIEEVDLWLSEAGRILDSNGIGEHPLRVELERALGARLAAAGTVSKGVEHFERAEAMLMTLFPNGHPDLFAVFEEHASALDAAGRVIEASAVRSRVRRSSR
jgi:tetratricopeptide (TPR) repeat protein